MFNKKNHSTDIATKLPKEVAHQIELNPKKGGFAIEFVAVQFGTMIGGFAIGGYWLWPLLEGGISARVLEIAILRNAWMYEYVFGFSLLVAIFAWIVVSAMVPLFIVSLLPDRLKLQYFSDLLLNDSVGGTLGNSLEKAAADFAGADASAAELVSVSIKRAMKFWLNIALPLIAASFLIYSFEYRSYSIYTDEGLDQVPFLPWRKPGVYSWEKVERVLLGCNQTDDGPSLIYEVRWKDGPSPRLADAEIVGELSHLEILEKIDRILVAGGARFERWSWLQRDPLHPKCLSAYRTRLGAEYAPRLDRLLRIGEFPGEGPVNEL